MIAVARTHTKVGISAGVAWCLIGTASSACRRPMSLLPIGSTLSLSDWNWLLPRDNQDYAWDCAACSTAWALRTIGFEVTEQDVIAGLGPARISPTYGLLDASGAGLVSYLAEMGVTAENNGAATWSDVLAASGYQPMVIGGRAWCHWVGVRMGTTAVGRMGPEEIALMNPADGYMGVHQVLNAEAFAQLGPFSAVWLTAW